MRSWRQRILDPDSVTDRSADAGTVTDRATSWLFQAFSLPELVAQ